MRIATLTSSTQINLFVYNSILLTIHASTSFLSALNNIVYNTVQLRLCLLSMKTGYAPIFTLHVTLIKPLGGGILLSVTAYSRDGNRNSGLRKPNLVNYLYGN